METNKASWLPKPPLARNEMCIAKLLKTQVLFATPRRQPSRLYEDISRTSRFKRLQARVLSAKIALRLIPGAHRVCTVSSQKYHCAKLSACHAQPRAESRNSVPAFVSFVVSRFPRTAKMS